MFSTTPVVYAVGDEYQIIFYVRRQAYAKIRIGGREFDDCVCGVMRSAKGMRKISVPRTLLEGCGEYTLVIQNILTRACGIRNKNHKNNGEKIHFPSRNNRRNGQGFYDRRLPRRY